MTDEASAGAFLGTKLLDPGGTRWRRKGWITAHEVDRLIKREAQVFRYEAEGDAVEVVPPAAVRELWARTRRHLEVPGSGEIGTPDAKGRTYGAHLWRAGDRRALGLQTFC